MRRTSVAARLVRLAMLLAPLQTGGVRAAETWPEIIALPDGSLPEGVVTGRGPVIYS